MVGNRWSWKGENRGLVWRTGLADSAGGGRESSLHSHLSQGGYSEPRADLRVF